MNLDFGARRKMRPFLSPGGDTNCFSSLTFHAIETVSHGLRQFPELQLLYVVEFGLLFDSHGCGKDWHSSCSISGCAELRRALRLGQVGRKEGLSTMRSAVRQQLDPSIRS